MAQLFCFMLVPVTAVVERSWHGSSCIAQECLKMGSPQKSELPQLVRVPLRFQGFYFGSFWMLQLYGCLRFLCLVSLLTGPTGPGQLLPCHYCCAFLLSLRLIITSSCGHPERVAAGGQQQQGTEQQSSILAILSARSTWREVNTVGNKTIPSSAAGSIHLLAYCPPACDPRGSCPCLAGCTSRHRWRQLLLSHILTCVRSLTAPVGLCASPQAPDTKAKGLCHCTSCGHLLRSDDTATDQKGLCSFCHKLFTVRPELLHSSPMSSLLVSRIPFAVDRSSCPVHVSVDAPRSLISSPLPRPFHPHL